MKVNGAHAYKMIDAYSIKKRSPACDSIVSSRQALALKGVPPEDHKEVLEVAQISGNATGKNLAKAAVVVAAKKPVGTAVQQPPKVYCETGAIIPQDLIPLWLRRDEVKKLMAAISEVKCHVEAAIKDKDPLYGEIKNDLVAQLGQVATASDTPFRTPSASAMASCGAPALSVTDVDSSANRGTIPLTTTTRKCAP